MSSRAETAYPRPTLVALPRCRRAVLGGTRWVAPGRLPGPARLHHQQPVRGKCVRLHAHSQGRDRGSGDIRVPPLCGDGMADHGHHRYGEGLASPVTPADSKSQGATLRHSPPLPAPDDRAGHGDARNRNVYTGRGPSPRMPSYGPCASSNARSSASPPLRTSTAAANPGRLMGTSRYRVIDDCSRLRARLHRVELQDWGRWAPRPRRAHGAF